MIGSRISRLVSSQTLQVIGLRGGIVGVNFLVMVGLAVSLGLVDFGRLSALWAAAMVAGTVLSLGGPIILMRVMTDGRGFARRDIAMLIFVLPVLLALWTGLTLHRFWPGLPLWPVLAAGLMINLLHCLAAVMRARGSVQWSMMLRDAGPQTALGMAGLAVTGAAPHVILAVAAAGMAGLAAAALIWVGLQPRQMPAPRRSYLSLPLYLSSIAGMGVAQVDILIGGLLIPPEALGLYALLRRIANLVALPVSVATWISAPQISAAFGSGDSHALARASQHGCRIAFWPGLALAMSGFLTVPFWPLLLPGDLVPGAGAIFAILVLGCLGQVVFTASYSVAQLCDQAALGLMARLGTILIYLLIVAGLGAALTPLANALAYGFALTAGGGFLAWAIKRRLGLDTSALSLLPQRGGRWKQS